MAQVVRQWPTGALDWIHRRSKSYKPPEDGSTTHQSFALDRRLRCRGVDSDDMDYKNAIDFGIPPYTKSLLANCHAIICPTLSTIDLPAEVTADRVDCRVAEAS